jgi:3' terminal RNA ribose 2'-O-methyltransferase Hen1
VKRGPRVVHGDKELVEKLGRNDPCPCGSGRRFQGVLPHLGAVSSSGTITNAEIFNGKAMLLTLTTTHQPATDLGFLLHKHPDKHQEFSLPFGTAHVFYPEADASRCVAALVLDVDPIALVRGRRGAGGDGGLLDQYVNDRPYAVSSFLSVALRRMFGSALGGRSEHRPELAALAIPLEARLTPLRCRGGIDLARSLFEPLGYALTATPVGAGPYWDVTLTGVTTLGRMLTHLYVLIPVLDDEKHYWVSEDEIEKLLRHGEGWLQQHPSRDLITTRYLKHQKRLARLALERLETVDDSLPETDEAVEAPAPKRRLNDERLARVAAELKASGAKSVVDLGCGSGKLLGLMMKDRQFERILGVDASSRDLEIAVDRLHLNELGDAQRQRISLIHGALTYRDRRLTGFDAAAVVEVIEHIDPPRLGAFADAVFGVARPRRIVLTTPNAEYNARYEALGSDDLRHADHRFEWSRAEFRAWAEKTAKQYGYDLRIEEIGEADPALGAPTQMGVFTCK